MGKRTYKQLNWTSRIKLETMLKHGHSKKEIAEELGVHISTIYRELKRGTYEHLNSDYTTEEGIARKRPRLAIKRGSPRKALPSKSGRITPPRSLSRTKSGMTIILRRLYAPSSSGRNTNISVLPLPCNTLQVCRGGCLSDAHKSRPPRKRRPEKEASKNQKKAVSSIQRHEHRAEARVY